MQATCLQVVDKEQLAALKVGFVLHNVLAFIELTAAAHQSKVGMCTMKLSYMSRFVNMPQAGAPDKEKSYRAVCELPCKVTAEVLAKLTPSQELPIKQYTPQRVSHRYQPAAAGTLCMAPTEISASQERLYEPGVLALS